VARQLSLPLLLLGLLQGINTAADEFYPHHTKDMGFSILAVLSSGF
jgi:hypothetical protein